MCDHKGNKHIFFLDNLFHYRQPHNLSTRKKEKENKYHN